MTRYYVTYRHEQERHCTQHRSAPQNRDTAWILHDTPSRLSWPPRSDACRVLNSSLADWAGFASGANAPAWPLAQRAVRALQMPRAGAVWDVQAAGSPSRPGTQAGEWPAGATAPSPASGPGPQQHRACAPEGIAVTPSAADQPAFRSTSLQLSSAGTADNRCGRVEAGHARRAIVATRTAPEPNTRR